MGEGVALLVLEAADVARRSGALPYAEVMGYGAIVGRPSHGPAATGRAGRGPGRNERADDGAVRPDEIDYVNAHASSTPIGDVAEARAIALSLGDARRDGSRERHEGALRAPARGVRGDRGGDLRPRDPRRLGARVGQPRDARRRGGKPAARACSEQGRTGTYRRVLSTSFGFGGLNAALVFGAVDGEGA